MQAESKGVGTIRYAIIVGVIPSWWAFPSSLSENPRLHLGRAGGRCYYLVSLQPAKKECGCRTDDRGQTPRSTILT